MYPTKLVVALKWIDGREHGCRQRMAGGPWSPWIFIHDTDKVEGLIVLFFGFVFSVAPLPPGNFSANNVLGREIFLVNNVLSDNV